MLGEGGQEIRHFILASAPFWIEYRRGTPGIHLRMRHRAFGYEIAPIATVPGY